MENINFKSPKTFIRFYHFSEAHNKKNFALLFCILIGYNIRYVQICFRILKQENIIILKNERNHLSSEAKDTFEVFVT
jgi:hypothetical protein